MTLRFSAEKNIDFNKPQFFLIKIINVMEYINVHWMSRNDKNKAICFYMKHLKI